MPTVFERGKLGRSELDRVGDEAQRGRGGKMYSSAMNSFRTSYGSVPAQRPRGTPAFSVVTTNIAQIMAAASRWSSRVLSSPMGRPSSRISMSARPLTATPHVPSCPPPPGRRGRTRTGWACRTRWTGRAAFGDQAGGSGSRVLPRPRTRRTYASSTPPMVARGWMPRVVGGEPGSARSCSGVRVVGRPWCTAIDLDPGLGREAGLALVTWASSRAGHRAAVSTAPAAVALVRRDQQDLHRSGAPDLDRPPRSRARLHGSRSAVAALTGRGRGALRLDTAGHVDRVAAQA